MLKVKINKTILLVSLILGSFLYNPLVLAEGMTREQGNAILNELGEMRKLLQRIEMKSSAPARKPAPTTAQVPSKGGSVIGDPKAPLTLVEFTDYQCPYCVRFYKNTFPQLKKKYIDTGKMRLIIKDLPLNFHQHARKAAQASRCAGEQGQFMGMHESLLSAGKNIEEKHLSGFAKTHSLDMKSFNNCLNSDRYLADIDKDTEQARKEGITGTPTFVLGKTTDNMIDGVRIVGAQSFQGFEKHIQRIMSN